MEPRRLHRFQIEATPASRWETRSALQVALRNCAVTLCASRKQKMGPEEPAAKAAGLGAPLPGLCCKTDDGISAYASQQYEGL